MQEVHGRLGRGRPPLTESREVSPEIKARVSSELRTRVHQEAERQGKSPPVFIREALDLRLTKADDSTVDYVSDGLGG